MTSPAAPSSPSPAYRQALLWVIKILVSAGLLYVLLSRMDLAHLWRLVHTASVPWLATALTLYLVMLLISAWRWGLLLRAQQVVVTFSTLMNSYLVATFANNFLPSNIGGDVIRIRDSAKYTGSKTLATAIVLADRGVGVLGLGFVAACGSTLAAHRSEAIGALGPSLLWTLLLAVLAASIVVLMLPERIAGLARPLRRFHQEWVDERIALLTSAMLRFRQAPRAMAAGLVGAVLVQGTLVAFYAAIARGLHMNVPLGHLAILVPVSFIVQMLPLSVNGLGVREATFGLYLTKIGVPLESAVALSFIGAALVMLFSMSGAAAYLTRRGQAAIGTADAAAAD